MSYSLPDYRRFAEAALQRLRKDHTRKTSNRWERMLLNVVLVAGLWGGVLYARWLIPSDVNPAQNLPVALFGKWQSEWLGDRGFLEFTPNHQLLLVRNGKMIESADYQIVGDVLMISGFTDQPSGRDLELQSQCYRISIHGSQLTINAADIGFTRVPEHLQFEKSGLRTVLPFWQGHIVHYQRAETAGSPRTNAAIRP